MATMALDLTTMLVAKPPWIIEVESAKDAFVIAEDLGNLGVTTRVLTAARMRTKAGLLEEFKSRLDFPNYFGYNWDALADCLADLDWLRGFAYALVVEDSQELLADESPDETKRFRDLIENVAARWAEPVSLGQDWDRPAIPFHVLLLGQSLQKPKHD